MRQKTENKQKNILTNSTLSISVSEGKYIRAIAILSEWDTKKIISSQELSKFLKSTPASITEMIKKLKNRSLLKYYPYQGVSLTTKGKLAATLIIRSQRIWQCFLSTKLNIDLEVIDELSCDLQPFTPQILTDRLDNYLGNPTYSPFGEPIPDMMGNFSQRESSTLDKIAEGSSVIISGIKDSNPYLIQYIQKKGITIGSKVGVLEIMRFDDSIEVIIDDKIKTNVSSKVASNIMVSL